MSFDIAWIVDFIIANLHWLFAFSMFVIIAHNGKRPVWHLLVLVGLLWAIVDLEHLLGLVFVSIIIFVPTDWILRTYLEGTSLQKHELKIIVIVFLLLTFINTFYFKLPGVL